ncbi:MAG: hypothetical protein HY067_01015 [Betaproteobacteria bacterium]|nr:hypothetical protein [Betaproteobacteria bacterium]
MKRKDLKTLTACSAVGLYGVAMIAVAVEHGREAIDESCSTPLECHAPQDLPAEIFDGSRPIVGQQIVAVSTSTAGPIIPGTGALTLTTVPPQQYIETPQPFITRPGA